MSLVVKDFETRIWDFWVPKPPRPMAIEPAAKSVIRGGDRHAIPKLREYLNQFVVRRPVKRRQTGLPHDTADDPA